LKDWLLGGPRGEGTVFISWGLRQLAVSVGKRLELGMKSPLKTLYLGRKIGIGLSFVGAVPCPPPPTEH
jgi:hypothetical protein